MSPPIGNRIVKVVPSPTCLSASIFPPCRAMIPYPTRSPSPPPRSPLVVKNGSNTRCLTSSVIPTPVSVTTQYACSPSVPVRNVTRPPPGHGIEGVEHEVRQDLAQLGRISGHRGERTLFGNDLVGNAADFGFLFPARAGELYHLVNQPVEVHRLERPRLPHARELLDPLDGPRRVLGGLLDHLKLPADARALGPREEKLDAPQDDGQGVVEVVGYPAGQLAQGPEPLGGDDLPLGRLELLQCRAELSIEAAVLQRDGRLVGERLEQRYLGLREVPHLPVSHDEGAGDLALHAKRHGKGGVDARPDETVAHVIGKRHARIVPLIPRPDRPPSSSSAPSTTRSATADTSRVSVRNRPTRAISSASRRRRSASS